MKCFANSDSDSSSDFDSDSGTDTNDGGPISESSSSDDSGDSDDEPTEAVWAKAASGVWGMAHVFDEKFYVTPPPPLAQEPGRCSPTLTPFREEGRKELQNTVSVTRTIMELSWQ